MTTDKSTSPTHMLTEAREGPAAVERLLRNNAAQCQDLAARLKATPPRFIVTCARGSSDNAATFGKYVAEIRLGMVTASVGPSVRSVYGVAPQMKDALFLAISQSGRSPDLLRLSEAAKESGAITVALVNDTTAPLADICDVVLPLHAGVEQSVAATKSYIAALAAVLQLLVHWSGDATLMAALDRLPEQLAQAADLDWSAALPLLTRVPNLYTAGRGVGFGIAQEAALKFKETAGFHAEAMSAAELIHGPMALAGADFPLFIFSQPDESAAGMRDVIDRFTARQVPVIAAGPVTGEGTIALPHVAGMNAVTAPIALVQSYYVLADAVARGRGRDPDRPPYLSKVTQTV